MYGGSRTIGETIPDNYFQNLEETLDNEIMRKAVTDAFKSLPTVVCPNFFLGLLI